ncbi:MAG: exodeoxyribonuclease VII large subunit, partial [Actinomycetota bacterium]|nr:exodeoxyribonuclease VII large subunit [Actinomycetota bacterium]
MNCEIEDWQLSFEENEKCQKARMEDEGRIELQEKVLTVSQVNRLARLTLEGISVTVEGEISRLQTGYRYYVYFDLRDSECSLPAVLTQRQMQELDFKLMDGIRVVVCGTLTIFERQGKYQIRIESIRPFGEGDIQRRIEMLKKKLHAEGLFDDSRKKPIPSFPERIGVVTSLRGAAVRDICVTIARRYPCARVFVRGVTVQGPDAIPEIVSALSFFEKRWDVDLVILGRGGGSLQDLEPFNSEEVARAIASVSVPVITGIGHEPDVTIADLVADRRASTPTGAAEAAVPDKAEVFAYLSKMYLSIARKVQHKLEVQGNSFLALVSKPLYGGSEFILGGFMQEWERSASNLFRSPVEGLLRSEARVLAIFQNPVFRRPLMLTDAKSRNLKATESLFLAAGRRALEKDFEHVRNIEEKLNALRPLSVLERGYSITFREYDNKIVRSSSDVEEGEALRIRLQKGIL